MGSKLKIKIKNKELAKAVGLDKLKAKLSGKSVKAKGEKSSEDKKTPAKKTVKIKAKRKSSFEKNVSKEPLQEAPPPSTPPAEPIEEKKPQPVPEKKAEKEPTPPPPAEETKVVTEATKKEIPEKKEKLGPTGKHIKTIFEKKPAKEEPPPPTKESSKKEKKVREFKDLKPARKGERPFTSRDKQGLSEQEDQVWRKRKAVKKKTTIVEENVVRPAALKIRMPITIKSLATEMKLKSSEILKKLFMEGMTYTLNDILDDETTIQYIGQEFGCDITIDTSKEERMQITTQSIEEEIAQTPKEKLKTRPPVVTFMGHVDHGKTSLIDTIRKTNLAEKESGSITQHIGAFTCNTANGKLTILDTPGHEAFSAMRARGTEVTDIVVLVVAGDEGMREQTLEAIQHAKAANVVIVVAINKCDKPNFNAENIYRQLSEVDLLPEAWGGETITVNTSAVSQEGIPELLEMLALQSEVLEIKANPETRARGTVLESKLHKGLGNIITVLVQNGTLRLGDAVVFDLLWGKIKTMHDEYNRPIKEASPSTPVAITGLSGLPASGDPFIVVKNEKEAKEIVKARIVDSTQHGLRQKTLPSLDKLLKEETEKKHLKLILRADVQGSLEALKSSIAKISSSKVIVDIIFAGVGEISESDIRLSMASDAAIIGFHSKVESHAESLAKEFDVTLRFYNVIYHAIDDIKILMEGLLEKKSEEKEKGAAEVKAIFKSSQTGIIAGCLVTEGSLHRNHHVRVVRNGEVLWKGNIASLKREKEDVKEVKKGLECGIVLQDYKEIEKGDILQTYEIIYLAQKL